jgi:hypothetical protein
LTVNRTSDNILHAKSKQRGQSAPPPNHEKSARDKNFEAEKREAISQVGHAHDDRKGDGPAAETRSGWFDDSTKEIGGSARRPSFESGWIYRRTETGHRRERSCGRDSVP